MLCRRLVVRVAALARDFDEAHVASAAALATAVCTTANIFVLEQLGVVDGPQRRS